VLVAVVREHLAEFPTSDPEDLVFKGPKGAALRRNNFHRSARCAECVAEAGLPEGFRFHDLRHTGNTLAASSGASTRELMHRMGAREYARRIDLSARHPASGIERLRLRSMRGSSAAVTANGP
jgi:integrase